jgi:2-haloacid dehalogenase
MPEPRLVVLDVLGTLVDWGSLRQRLVDAGADGRDLERVLAETLRDAFAVSATGEVRPFRALLEGGLRASVPELSDDGVAHVVEGVVELDLHADAQSGVRALADTGVPLTALSNGGTALTTQLLLRNGLRDMVPTVIGVDDAGVSKPGREPYLLACHTAGVTFAEAAMVSAHPWDLHGARSVGMPTVWVDRSGAHWPAVFGSPDMHVASLFDVPGALGLTPRG